MSPDSSDRPGPTTGAPVRVPAATVALSTASAYPETCVDAFAMAADLGYDGVEVMVWPDPVTQDAAALQRLSDHYSMPVLAVHAPTLLVTQRVWGRDPWAKVERSCELARRLGAPTVVVHPPFRWQREYATGFVEGVVEISARTGVTIAVENMYPWRARGREVLAYLPGWDPVPLPYSHVTLDLSHTATAGSDGLGMARDLGGRLAHVHLADGLGSAKDEHLVPGRGGQPCGAVLGLLAERGWEGCVVVEVNTRRCRTRAERESDLAESLAFARLHLAAPAAAEGRVPGAPPLPPERLVPPEGGPEILLDADGEVVVGADGEVQVTEAGWPSP
ncbi:sugar phosphate isomerase/epimerase [Kineosporia sp. R_H_3]|uniref:sugar phosphate isomerase/epimerase family protein n=1 Tax=Kineosporia sp. R_H_3 TaxID=1961848 RepID=UPI001E645D0C|nr:sugar phosphate isomerase/epimerase [Kineosporia sp. R_H_3]